MNRLIDKIEYYLPAVRLIMRIALICSSVIMVAFIVPVLNYTADNRLYDAILWYGILFCMWTLFCSIPLLFGIAVYKKLSGKEIWSAVKRETVLLIINIVIAVLFLIITLKN